MANCGGCGKVAGGGTVQCKGCDMWWHQSCSGMKKSMYELILLTTQENGDHCWCCRVCICLKDSLKQSILALEAKYQNLDGRVTVNTDNIQANMDNIQSNTDKLDTNISKTDKLSDTVDQLKVSLEGVASKDGSSVVDNDFIFNEIREREARKCNILVHGIPEPEADSNDKNADDKSELKSLAAAIGIKIDASSDIKFCYRVGIKSDNNCRPLKVGFYEQRNCERFLSTSWKLKGNKKLSYNASIVSDITNQQRSEEAKLRKQVDDDNSKLSAEDTHCFRLVGRRGHRIIVKVKKQVEGEQDNSNRKRPLSPETSSNIQTRHTDKAPRI
jgi:hypothetical protein